MCNGPILPSVIKYTIPIILTGLLQLAFNAADMMVVGMFCGSTSVGAVGATSSLTNLLVNLFIGMGSGVSVVTAKAIGAKNAKDTNRLVHTAVPLGILAGALLTVLGILAGPWCLDLMGTPRNLLPLSSLYMRVYFCGMIPNLGFNFCAAILRAAGDTKSPMKFLTIAGFVNVTLNVIFVTILHMDVAGVALATIIAQSISFVLVIRALICRNDDCKLDPRRMRLDGRAVGSILRIGLPAGLQSTVFSISNVIIQSSVNSFGPSAVAGNAAAGNLEGFVYVGMNAFYQTSLNFTGQNVGAGKLDRVKKTLLCCLISVAVVGYLLGAGFRFFANDLLKLYVKDDPAAIAYAITRMTYVCQFYFMCGMMETLNGTLRGMGASVLSLLISVIGVCGVRLVWIFTVFRSPQFHSLDSLYFSYDISWLMCILVQILAVTILYKKRKKQIQ
jgi:putative MATE family efflux protein